MSTSISNSTRLKLAHHLLTKLPTSSASVINKTLLSTQFPNLEYSAHYSFHIKSNNFSLQSLPISALFLVYFLHLSPHPVTWAITIATESNNLPKLLSASCHPPSQQHKDIFLKHKYVCTPLLHQSLGRVPFSSGLRQIPVHVCGALISSCQSAFIFLSQNSNPTYLIYASLQKTYYSSNMPVF